MARGHEMSGLKSGSVGVYTEHINISKLGGISISLSFTFATRRACIDQSVSQSVSAEEPESVPSTLDNII